MGIWRATWTIDHPSLGGTGTNTWHARTAVLAGSPAEHEQLDLLNGHLGEFYTALEDIYAGGAHLHFNGEWLRVDVDPPEVYAGDTNDLVVGGTTDALPPANCLVVGWRTSVASKSGRGRTFLGPLRTADNEANGTPSEPVRAEIATACADFISSFDGVDSGAFGVYSKKDGVIRDFISGRVANKFGMLTSRRD
jgi:hypothetical protein